MFLLDNSISIVFGIIIALFALQFYIEYFRANNTDSVDIAQTYNNKILREKYGRFD